jgi:PAS domain S-box-containing protein
VEIVKMNDPLTKEAQERDERYREFFKNVPLHRFLLLDSAFHIVDGNDVVLDLFSNIFGMSKEELIGKDFVKLIPGFEGSERHQKYLEVLKTGTPFYTDEVVPPPDAGRVSISVLVFKAGDGLGIIATDITERKQAREALRESEERYRNFFDESPTALWEIDASYAKDHCDRLRRNGVRELRTYFEDHPEETRRCWNGVKLVEMNKACVELFEAGSREELLGRLEGVFPEEEPSESLGGVIAIAEGRGSFERQVVTRTLAGKKKHILYRWSVVPGYEKTYSKVLVAMVDVTDRVQLAQELLKIQKLESVGVLAGGIAHDFNNILTAVSANIGMAMMYGELQGDILEMLTDAERAALRAKKLTQQLLTFAKGGVPIKKKVPIARTVEDTVEFALSGSNVRGEYQLPKDLWWVEADEGQVGQVIQNLTLNADQAMAEGGIISVRAENVRVGEGDGIPLEEGEYVRISIRDRGIGIPERHLHKIFDPFFTTKQKGSGLGLATAYNIVKHHDGYIQVRSEVDVGTTFSVYLPGSRRGAEQKETEKYRRIQGQGRVLLIDDEEMIRKSASELIRRLGYEVVVAEGSFEGIGRYQEAMKEEKPFDAVILDLTIPGDLGGKEAVRELLAGDSAARVIASSGYSNDPVMAEFKEYGFRGVIAKPYQINELSEVLHKVITAIEG